MTADLDALELLRKVSDAYRAITTLEVEAVNINESGDADASSHSEQRVRFIYSSPNRVRYEPCGRSGMVQVVDGTHLHTLFRRAHGFKGGPRLNSIPISEMHFLPHVFRPDFPLGPDGTFLFQGINEHVAGARIVRQEDDCYVVAVTYEPLSHPLMTIRGDILFWVSTNSLIVMKQQGDLGHRFPADDEVMWSRLTMSVRKIRLNEPISEDAFRFTPPADAISVATGRRGISTSSGGGFIDEGRGIEHHGSHEWQGDTLIEHSRWKIRGITLTFERRLTFSHNERELNIAERIEGPQGEAEGSFKVSLK